MKTDDPAQYFFTQNVESKDLGNLPQSQKIYSKYMRDAGIVGEVKIVTIPKAKNKVLVRFQNLADQFDFDNPKMVNLTTVVEGMWKSAHGEDSEVLSFSLRETSVTGTMTMSEMQSRRLKWQTEDDEDIPKTNLSYTVGDDNMLWLEPMRIRVFMLEYFEI